MPSITRKYYIQIAFTKNNWSTIFESDDYKTALQELTRIRIESYPVRIQQYIITTVFKDMNK